MGSATLPPGFTIQPPAVAGVKLPPQGFTIAPPASPDVGDDVRRSAVSGAQEGVYGLAGAPGDILQAGSAANKALGLKPPTDAGGQEFTNEMIGTQPWATLTPPTTAQVEQARGFTPYQPTTGWGHVARSAAAFVPGAAAAGLTGGVTAIPAAAARGAGIGALSGAAGNVAADNFGDANRPWGEIGGAVLSGYGVSKVAGTAGRTATRVAAPTTDDLKAASQSFYAASDKAGIAISPATMKSISADVAAAALKANAYPGLTDKALSALGAVQDAAASGKPMTLSDLDNLRKVVRQAQDEGSAAASAIVNTLTDRMNGLQAADVVSGADPKQAVAALNQARSLWQQMSKSDTIGKVISDAQLLQTADKPGAYPAALQAGFRKLARDPNFTRFWSPDEQAAIITAAKGGGIGPQLVRLAGRTVGANSSLPMIPMLGQAVRGVGNMGITQGAAYADALARMGPNVNPFTAILPIPRTTQDLAGAFSGASLPFRQPAPR